MARIRIEALERPTEQELDAQQARGVVGAGPRGIISGGPSISRGFSTFGPRTYAPYYWGASVTYWGGPSVFYNNVPAVIYPWGAYYYQPPVIIEPVQPVIVNPWGW